MSSKSELIEALTKAEAGSRGRKIIPNEPNVEPVNQIKNWPRDDQMLALLRALEAKDSK